MSQNLNIDKHFTKLENTIMASYNNLICIAIGFCSAYAYISKSATIKTEKILSDKDGDNGIPRENNNYFLKFLDDLALSSISRITAKKTADLKELDEIRSRVEFALDSKMLKADTNGAIFSAWSQLKIVKTDIQEKESAAKRCIKIRTQALHLSKISFVLAVYGILILFLSCFESHTSINIYVPIAIGNVLILTGLFFCCIAEFELKPLLYNDFNCGSISKCKKRVSNAVLWFIRKLCYPTFRKFIIVLIVTIIIMGIFLIPNVVNRIPIDIDSRIFKTGVAHFSLITLFSGFLMYVLMSYSYCQWKKSRFKHYLKSVKIPTQVGTIKQMVDRYSPELDEVSNTLNNKEITLNDINTFRIP